METARMPEESTGHAAFDTPQASKASRAPSSARSVRMAMPVRQGSKKNLMQKSATPEAPKVHSEHLRATSAPPAASKSGEQDLAPIDLLVARDLDAHAEDEAFALQQDHEGGLPEGYVHPQVVPSADPAIDPTIKADLDTHAEDEVSSIRILKARLSGPPGEYLAPGPVDDSTVYPKLYRSNPTTRKLPLLIAGTPVVGDFVSLYKGDKLVGATVLQKEGGYLKVKYFNAATADWVVAQSTRLYVAGSPRWGKSGRLTGRKRKLGESGKKLKQMILSYFGTMLEREAESKSQDPTGLMEGLKHLKIVAPATVDFKQKAPKRFKASRTTAEEVDLPERPVVGEIVALARNSATNAEALVTASEGGYIKVKFTDDCFESWVVADSVSRPSKKSPPVKASDGKQYRQLKLTQMWRPAGGPRARRRRGGLDTGIEGSSSSSSTTDSAVARRMKITDKALYIISSEMLIAAAFGAFIAWAANRALDFSSS